MRERISVDALIARWRRTGDRRARDHAVRRSLPLARGLAVRYVSSHEPLDDLVQVANVGLVKAVDRFDPERGVRFSTFAVPTISGELRRHFRSSAWTIHAPRMLQEGYLAVRQASERLMQRDGRAPTVAELARATKLDPELVVEALQAREAQRILSLDQPLRGEDDDERASALGEQIGGEDPRLALVEDAASLAPALRRLTPRQRRIVAMRFGEDRVQREIARELGCSQMQVSRELRRALDELRAAAAPSPPGLTAA
ncbi:MAG TPA: SigB/SigF/SigG family RNA polymerase sigma factor [Conexibacter sp.]|nr:SigB/SigF/SigG family RNA polymerase sigma factor [Conexibacter sp.]